MRWAKAKLCPNRDNVKEMNAVEIEDAVSALAVGESTTCGALAAQLGTRDARDVTRRAAM